MTDRHRRRTTALRIDPVLHERLRAVALERTVSVNLIVNRAIADFLDHLIPVDEIRTTRNEPEWTPPAPSQTLEEP